MRLLKPNPSSVAAKIIDGEAIIMNLGTGAYYSMTDSGAAVWAMIERGASLEAIQTAIANRFGVEPSLAGEDVERLVNELITEGLVVPTEGLQGEPPVPEPAESRGVYQPPVLNKYTEMADLLALDPPMPELPPQPDRAG